MRRGVEKNMYASDLLFTNHTSQFNLGLPKPVERCCCGVASAIFTLKYFIPEIKDSNNNLAMDFINSGQYTRPLIGVKFKDQPDNIFPVLLSKSENESDIQTAIEQAKDFLKVYAGDVTSDKYILEVTTTIDTRYAPCFLMRSGTDIRGISNWLTSYYLQTEIIEYREQGYENQLEKNHTLCTSRRLFADIFKKSLVQDNTLLIPSVVQNKLDYNDNADVVRDDKFTGTHLVVATKNGNPNHLRYMDPAYRSSDAGIKRRNIEDFLDIMIDTGAKRGHFLTVRHKTV